MSSELRARTCVICGGGIEHRHLNATSCGADRCTAEMKRCSLMMWKREHPDKVREYARDRYQRRRKEILERERTARSTPEAKEKARNQKRRHRENNSEIYRERSRRYAEKNREKINDRAAERSRNARAALKLINEIEVKGLEALL